MLAHFRPTRSSAWYAVGPSIDLGDAAIARECSMPFVMDIAVPARKSAYRDW